MLTKLFRTFTLLISFQLVLSPLALAQQNQQRAQSMSGKIESGINWVGSLAQQFLQQGQQGAPQNVEGHKSSLSSLRPQYVDPAQIPPVYRSCQVLAQEQNNTIGLTCPEMASKEKKYEYGSRRIDTGYFQALAEIADDNAKELKSDTIEGAARYSNKGATCFEKKYKDFEGQLEKREEELNILKNNITAKIENFNETSKESLDQIKKSSALLEGKPKKYLKDTRFNEMFLGPNDDDPVCGSLLDGGSFSRTGTQGGLRGIEKMLHAQMTSKPQGSLSASEVLSKQKQLNKDIDNIAKSIAGEAKVSGSALSGLTMDLSAVSTNTKYIKINSPSLERISDSYNKDITQEIKKMKKDLKIDKISRDSRVSSFLNRIDSDSLDADEVDEELIKFQNGFIGNCFKSYITNGGKRSIESFVKKFRNPSVSKKKSRKGISGFKSYLASMIQNANNLDINKVIKQISTRQKKAGNSKYLFRPDKVSTNSTNISGDLETSQIKATGSYRPAAILGTYAKNCTAQFTNNKTNGITMSQAVKNISAYSKKLKAKRKSAQSSILAKIRTELRDCPSDTATGEASLSCQGAMSQNQPNFCVKTAVKCAKNYKACHNHAKTFVKNTRDAQLIMAKQYNDQMKALKTDLKVDLIAIQRFMTSQARFVDAQLDSGTVFKLPLLEFDITAEQYPLKDEDFTDESLKIEDPKAYLEMAMNQIDKMKSAYEEHKDKLLKEMLDVKEKYRENYLAQEEVWKKINTDCISAGDNYDQQLAKQNQAKQEQQKDIMNACAKINSFGSSMSGYCNVGGELADDIGKIAGKAGDAQAALIAIQRNNNICNSNKAKETKPQAISFGMVDKWCTTKGASVPECSLFDKGNRISFSNLLPELEADNCYKNRDLVDKNAENKCPDDSKPLTIVNLKKIKMSVLQEVSDKKTDLMIQKSSEYNEVKSVVASKMIPNGHGEHEANLQPISLSLCNATHGGSGSMKAQTDYFDGIFADDNSGRSTANDDV